MALNCVANGRLLREGPFERIWIQPAAGDAGGALGAALSAWHRYLDQPRRPDGNRDTLTLHVFLDKSVMEVFVNDGRPCVTRVIDSQPDDLGIEAFAAGGAAVLKRVDVWQMEPAWDG